MRSQWKRLLWAALLSGAGFLTTIMWYNSTEKSNLNSGEKPLAQVGKVDDEVLRRPATRLLWHSVNTGDSLYNGEAIRTSSRGEIRIQFDDGRFIDLESDSLIVLQKSKGEIALDLMEGSVFVNAKSADAAGSAPGLVLNSAQGKVDLTGASASLAKGQGNRLDVQVVEGKATLQGTDGKSRDLEKGSSGALGSNGLQFNQQNLQIISPVAEKPVFVDPLADSSVQFQWKGFPADWKVSVWAGSRRKDLKEWATTEPTQSSQLKTKFPLGKHFWKLVAKDPKTGQIAGESAVYRLEVVGRYAPTVIFPISDATIEMDKPNYELPFQWQKGEETRALALEVFEDSTMKKTITSKSFATEDGFKLSGLKEGTYYWRLSAYYNDSSKPIIGKVQKFTLKKQVIVPPKEPAQIVWTIPETATTQYFAKDPILQVSWAANTRKEEITQWRFQYQETTASEDSRQTLETKDLKARTNLTQAGQYRITVEALDKLGQVIGKSADKVIAVQPFPLLESPKILPLGSDLRAQENGRSDIQWQSVEGAKEYEMVVKNSEGKELARKNYKEKQAQLKNLLPGKYFVQVTAIDQYGRTSANPEVKTLLVPDKSNVRAPSNFRVKVKEE